MRCIFIELLRFKTKVAKHLNLQKIVEKFELFHLIIVKNKSGTNSERKKK